MAQHLTRLFGPVWLSLMVLMIGTASAQADNMPRDPTLPPLSISAPANAATMNTTSPIELISIRGSHRSAIVRGVSVHAGDQISEGRIVKITENGIVVKSDNSYSVLQLYPDVSKHRHSQSSQQRIQR